MGAVHSAVLALSMTVLSWFIRETHREPVCGFATLTGLFCWAGPVKITLLCLLFFSKGICCVFV